MLVNHVYCTGGCIVNTSGTVVQIMPPCPLLGRVRIASGFTMTALGGYLCTEDLR